MKKMISLVLVLALCLSLVACGISEEELAGTWTGSWTYNGNSFDRTLIFDDDGNYESIMYKNGELYKTESGTYEISGNNVDLHPGGDEGQTTPYKVKGGKLVNNGHEMVKQ